MSPSNSLTNNPLQQKLGATFQSGAERYDSNRPSYPLTVTDAIARFADVTTDSMVGEIGSGTSIATGQLADWGAQLTCFEPSANYVTLAIAKLAGRGNIAFVVSALEAAYLRRASFDVLTAFQSLHWVDAGRVWQLTAEALKPGGVLAYASNFPDTGNGLPPTPAIRREQQVRQRYIEGCPDFPQDDYGSLGAMRQRQEVSQLFELEPPVRICHTQIMTRDAYVEFQATLSWIAVLPDDDRYLFLASLIELLGDAQTIEMPWVTELVLSRRR